MDIKETLLAINNAHKEVFEKIDADSCNLFCDIILKAKKVFLLGVGREGISLKPLAMRLVHLGIPAYWVWDETTPAMGKDDLFRGWHG